MATMKDIARHAGVSPITVSRVVNNSGYVKTETRERVESAIRELDFIPNRLASSLRSQNSRLLALILPDITNSYWTSIARGAEDEAWANGYSLFICNSDNSPEKEAAYVHSLISRQVEGVLIVPTPHTSSQEQIRLLLAHSLDVIVVHRAIEAVDVDTIRNDGETAAEQLTAALVASGRRRIGFVGLPHVDTPTRERLRGYELALRTAGIAIDPDLIAFDDSYDAHGDVLTTRLLNLPNPPDALLLTNSRLALHSLRTLDTRGIRVPEDMAVAVFHDISTLDHYAPRLIRAVQPAYRMGQLAVRRLFERKRQPDGRLRDILLSTPVYLPEGNTP